MVSGDEWKKGYSEKKIPMGAVYELSNALLKQLLRSDDYVRSFFEIVDTFKPKDGTVKSWKNECIDALVDGYISHDAVFIRSLDNPPPIWNRYLQVKEAYRCGVFHAIRYGWWGTEAVHRLKQYEHERDKREPPPPTSSS